MKFVKPLLTFLFFVVLSGTILSLLTPASQKVEKSITIHAPASVVYAQLSKLDNFNKWSVWNVQDSSAVFTLTGTDGTIGAATSWKGNPSLAGEGRLEITSLEPGRKIVHSLQLLKPKKIKALSAFTLNEMNGITSVTWNFEAATPRPWNIFNLFYSLDKEMGNDFEKGLFALKEMTEKMYGSAPVKSYEVLMMDFPASTFALIRQQVKWADITGYFSQHLPILYDEARKHNINAGTPAGLYYEWDEKNQQTDMAVAIPVPAGTKLQHNIISIENINASKAVYVNYTGAYEKIGDAHSSLDRYIAEKKLTQKSPVIEQYIHGPANEKDTAKWLTKVVYLVD